MAQFTAAVQRGDAAGVTTIYTEDAQVLPPDSDILTGKQAIQAFWQGAIDMGIKAVTFDMMEAEQCGHTAYEVGTFTLQGASGQVLDTGKYVVIWKQQAGQWKLHRDIFNSSRPAPGQ